MAYIKGKDIKKRFSVETKKRGADQVVKWMSELSAAGAKKSAAAPAHTRSQQKRKPTAEIA